MFRIKFALTLAAVTVFLVGGSGFFGKAYASDSEKQAGSQQQDKQEAPKQANNDICPVMGGKIDFKSPSYVTYEYNGTVYNFCCDGCIDEFQKDPEKYIKKLEEQKNTKGN
jgi:YHS domain-containing protein